MSLALVGRLVAHQRWVEPLAEAAVSAVATGMNDLRDLLGQSRRIAAVHAVLNLAGISLTTALLAGRRSGRRGLARSLSGLGYLVSVSAARLGGELSSGLGIRATRLLGQTVADAFVPVLDETELRGDELCRVELEGVPVLLARAGGEPCAVADTSTHLGGPLTAGTRQGDTVACPWHWSRIDLGTSAVLPRPAFFRQAALHARVRDGRIEIGHPGGGGAELLKRANRPLRGHLT